MYLFKQTQFPGFVFLLVITWSCTTTVNDHSTYFPVDSLIRAQAIHLVEINASLTKHAQIDGTEETTSFIPADTNAWLKELDIFSALNAINKPVNHGGYEVTEGRDEASSNLVVRAFTSKISLPVEWLKVYYQDSPRNIRRMEALYREDSSLMKGSRMVIMEFQELNNKITLTSYSIEGGQAMFLASPVEFSITGTITSDSWLRANTNR
ncbi:hypothetical protein QQ054_15255 [Oscillatoria amoena NRMC-F 0135]|nr:hypothetical protein [Oscillatoria amoena NRMC-F 0135]